MSLKAAVRVDADEVYHRLVDLHEGCSDEESLRRNFRLILLLIEQIENPHDVIKAIEAAKPHG